MHIVITGANGFIGNRLIQKLLNDTHINNRPITKTTAIDRIFTEPEHTSSQLILQPCDLAQQGQLTHVLKNTAMDIIFHLASIPGGSAEENYEAARAVNIDATLELLELCKGQVEAGGVQPQFIFASSIAVFGDMADLIHDASPLRPKMTYGSQKLIGEIQVNDFSRRGWVDGYSLRIPGVLARPKANTGHLSAFLSNIFHDLSKAVPFTCPTTSKATTWASSIVCVVENLIHCSRLSPEMIGPQRSVTLPTLRFTLEALVEAISEVYNVNTKELVTYEPDEEIESLFGNFPELSTEKADKLGFKSDGDLISLVRRALSDSA